MSSVIVMCLQKTSYYRALGIGICLNQIQLIIIEGINRTKSDNLENNLNENIIDVTG